MTVTTSLSQTLSGTPAETAGSQVRPAAAGSDGTSSDQSAAAARPWRVLIGPEAEAWTPPARGACFALSLRDEFIWPILTGKKKETRRLNRRNYGLPGDPLYVQERFSVDAVRELPDGLQALVVYYRDGERLWRPVPPTHRDYATSQPGGKIHARRFMPAWASRLWLRKGAEYLQRLSSMTDADARRDGFADLTAFRDWWDTYHADGLDERSFDDPTLTVLRLLPDVYLRAAGPLST